MICPLCKAENATSTVTAGVTSSTCMAFSPGHYDESGAWVRHADPNWHTTTYACSRGHTVRIRRREGEPDVIEWTTTLTVSRT